MRRIVKTDSKQHTSTMLLSVLLYNPPNSTIILSYYQYYYTILLSVLLYYPTIITILLSVLSYYQHYLTILQSVLSYYLNTLTTSLSTCMDQFARVKYNSRKFPISTPSNTINWVVYLTLNFLCCRSWYSARINNYTFQEHKTYAIIRQSNIQFAS